ncbi:unnamed protein product [Miscanthus lutarioriparius]|uniref:KIB1-4 beta-propeller domain-containing protein n=1 Tax=Miscanthus lutarioriparius TaxID=422564 RepID=A0A811SA56_9POAL|nr:unnamed protein product [Miscanthus lutarioriparius]
MKEARSSSWSDLLPEILGLVLRRLPSLADRVRLRAVCRPWRSNAQLDPLPPLLPWLTLLDGTFLSIPDGKIIRMPIPDKGFCRGSVDNWMFFVHNSDGDCSLMNLFSKATLNISKLDITWLNGNSRYYNSHFYKLMAPLPLESSPGSLVALEGGGRLRICQPPIAVDLWLHLDDITFFNGKLYGLNGNVLSIFEINYGLNGKPKISSVRCITSYPTFTLRPPQPLPRTCLLLSYLVECCGRLLMVKRMIGCNPEIKPCPLESDRTAGFQVFEADLSTKPGQWICVRELGSQALFVGMHCSKSFPAGECTGVEENCIYFMRDYFPANLAADPLSDSGVYNMKSGNIKPLLSETAAVPQHRGGQWRPTWIFPADAM